MARSGVCLCPPSRTRQRPRGTALPALPSRCTFAGGVVAKDRLRSGLDTGWTTPGPRQERSLTSEPGARPKRRASRRWPRRRGSRRHEVVVGSAACCRHEAVARRTTLGLGGQIARWHRPGSTPSRERPGPTVQRRRSTALDKRPWTNGLEQRRGQTGTSSMGQHPESTASTIRLRGHRVEKVAAGRGLARAEGRRTVAARGRGRQNRHPQRGRVSVSGLPDRHDAKSCR